MLPLKFIYNDGEKSVSVPTNWAEVQFSKLLELINSEDKSVDKAISVFTGIPIDDLKAIPEPTYWLIANLFTFIADTTKLFSSKYDNTNKIDVRQEAWGKIEACKIHLRNLDGKHEWNAAVEVIRTYADIDISDMNAPDAVAMASFFLNRLKTFSPASRSCRLSNRLKMNWLRGSKTSRYLDIKQQWIGSHLVTRPNTMQFSTCQHSSSMKNYCSMHTKTVSVRD